MPGKEIPRDIVRVTLELTREDIQKLRDRVKNEFSSSSSSLHEGLHLSTFVVAYDYVWTCMVKARGGHAERPVSFLFVADLRHRLEPPIPETYFGNCIAPTGCYDQKARTYLEEKGFVTAVKTLSDLVNGLGPRRRTKTVYEMFVASSKAARSGCQLGSVAGSTRLGVYESDFGWGKPVKIEVVSIDNNGAISMSESRDWCLLGEE